MTDRITIERARQHNLCDVTLSLPRGKLIAFTGVSGSGKSSLAIDTLHVESQRQYMEALGLVNYAGKPPVGWICGLPPSICLAQGLANRTPRSTLGTASDVYTYLRILFARVGHRPCPGCGMDVPPEHGCSGGHLDEALEYEDAEGTAAGLDDPDLERIPCPHCGRPLPALSMSLFSFNKPAGACSTCTGLGIVYAPNIAQLLDEDRSILDGAVRGWVKPNIAYQASVLRAAGHHYGFEMPLDRPVRLLDAAQRALLLYGVGSPQFRQHYPGKEPPATVAAGRFEGIATALLRRHTEHANDLAYLARIEQQMRLQTCPDCGGARLRPEMRVVTVAGWPLVAAERDGERPAVAQMTLDALARWLAQLSSRLPPGDWPVAEPIVRDLSIRIHRLQDVGLGYLSLGRTTPSLSAGEGLRLRLSALLSSSLTGMLYVLDEPTVGLHARDTTRLIGLLKGLRDRGNTVLVVEHDLDMIAAADHVVEFGPGAGRAGGRIVAQGTPRQLADDPASITGRYISGKALSAPWERHLADGPSLHVNGACAHNIKDLSVRLPLRTSEGSGLLVAVTGVSGSGKSTLVFDILAADYRLRQEGADAARTTGWHYVDRVITVDQSPLGAGSRSNAVTYTEAYAGIRQAYAAQPAAREAGLTARHFSFNVPGGRCERCQGTGTLAVEMHFMPEVLVRCPVCQGRRFRPEVLSVRYGERGSCRGHDIASLLDLTVEEALPLFDTVPAVRVRLSLLAETGLGYLPLGQPASSLSGGEAQRIKLARELSRSAAGHTLYLLDEPTTGLHPADVRNLMALLGRLLSGGHTVIAIEHNLELIRCADWVVDLGPEGGDGGGRLVAEGAPKVIAATPGSYTGAALRRLSGAL